MSAGSSITVFTVLRRGGRSGALGFESLGRAAQRGGVVEWVVGGGYLRKAADVGFGVLFE